jgi:uncharacterized membrane protein YdcZ (DUF606 family)
MKWLASVFAFIAGTLITCQVGSNSQLNKSLGQPLPALIVNYVMGLAAVCLYTFNLDCEVLKQNSGIEPNMPG